MACFFFSLKNAEVGWVCTYWKAKVLPYFSLCFLNCLSSSGGLKRIINWCFVRMKCSCCGGQKGNLKLRKINYSVNDKLFCEINQLWNFYSDKSSSNTSTKYTKLVLFTLYTSYWCRNMKINEENYEENWCPHIWIYRWNGHVPWTEAKTKYYANKKLKTKIILKSIKTKQPEYCGHIKKFNNLLGNDASRKIEGKISKMQMNR